MQDHAELNAVFRAQRRPRRQGPSGLVWMIGVLTFVVFAIIVDVLTFSITRGVTRQPNDMQAYLEHRLPDGLLAPRVLDLTLRDFAAEPLTEQERLALGRAPLAILPSPPDGWSLRPLERADFWLLRPDMAACEKHEEDVLRNVETIGALRRCPPGFDSGGVWTYARGEERIAVSVVPQGFGLRSRGSAFVRGNFRSLRNLRPYKEKAGWRFLVLPGIQTISGEAVVMPKRLIAKQKKAEEVHVFVVSNASDALLRDILAGLDRTILNAMAAPLP